MVTGGKKFSFHWGSGMVVEEARVEGEYHLPTIQLLKYTEGDALGGVAVRFCHYSHSGGFRRSPLMMSLDEVEAMREALKATPELLALLKRMIGA